VIDDREQETRNTKKQKMPLNRVCSYGVKMSQTVRPLEEVKRNRDAENCP